MLRVTHLKKTYVRGSERVAAGVQRVPQQRDRRAGGQHIEDEGLAHVVVGPEVQPPD